MHCSDDTSSNWTLGGVPKAFGAACHGGENCPGPMECFPAEDLGFSGDSGADSGVCSFPCVTDSDCPSCTLDEETIPHCFGCTAAGACYVPRYDK